MANSGSYFFTHSNYSTNFIFMSYGLLFSLRMFGEKKYFSYSHLNQKIESKELGYMEDNRPCLVFRSDKTQLWNVSVFRTTSIDANLYL